MTTQLTWSGNSGFGTLNGGTPSTGAPPAVLPYNGYLYVIYATSHSDSPSLWQMVYDGTKWDGNTRVSFSNSSNPPQSLCGPALAELSGTLYLAWVTQPASKSQHAQINVASAKPLAGRKPISSDKWTLLAGKDITGGSNTPSADTYPIAMVAYPYKGVDSLWLFYNYLGMLWFAIAQPQPNDVIKWVYWTDVGNWSAPIQPKLGGGVTAAVVDYESYSAPYVVFTGSGGSNLYYVYFNPVANQFEGNERVTSTKGNTGDIKTASNPTLFAFPDPANRTSPMPALLLYQGQHGSSVDVALFKNGSWSGNVEISSASKDHGMGGPINPTINPPTNIGIGAAYYDTAHQIVMVYQSASAYGTFSES